jgi:hypothetical protein
MIMLKLSCWDPGGQVKALVAMMEAGRREHFYLGPVLWTGAAKDRQCQICLVSMRKVTNAPDFADRGQGQTVKSNGVALLRG